jgi:hypothetical protein
MLVLPSASLLVGSLLACNLVAQADKKGWVSQFFQEKCPELKVVLSHEKVRVLREKIRALVE